MYPPVTLTWKGCPSDIPTMSEYPPQTEKCPTDTPDIEKYPPDTMTQSVSSCYPSNPSHTPHERIFLDMKDHPPDTSEMEENIRDALT